MRRAAFAGFVASLALGAGCSLVTSLDGYTDGSRDAGSTTSTEAGAADASPGHDASTEASAAVRFCDGLSPRPMLCEDFDGVALGPGWQQGVAPGAAVAIDDGGAKSPPASLLSTTNGTDTQYALTTHDLGDSVHVVHYAFDVRVDRLGAYMEGDYIKLTTAVGAQNHYLKFGKNPFSIVLASEVYFDDGGLVQHTVEPANPPAQGAFTHVEVDVDLDAHTATLRLDGVLVGTNMLEPGVFVPGAAKARVGIEYAPQGDPWALRNDNVTVSWQ